MLNKRKIIMTLIIGVILIVLITLYFAFTAKTYPKNGFEITDNFFGVTYSKKFSSELGLDWKETHQQIIDDLKVKYIRLPIYWEDVEYNKGVYDFSDYDYLISEGKKNNVNYIINLGYRLPRWPECHFPQWLDIEDKEELENSLLNYLELSIKNFKNHNNVLYWQIENEPYLGSFGICPKLDIDLFNKEIELVKSLDDRKIIISASGELSTWHREKRKADIFATTLYRVVHNPYFGFFKYPLPASFYYLKAKATGIEPKSSLIIELQAEPWSPNGSLVDIEELEYNKSFDLEQLKANAYFATKTNFQQAYLWGVEWWYLQKIKGNERYWEFAKTLFE